MNDVCGGFFAFVFYMMPKVHAYIQRTLELYLFFVFLFFCCLFV